MEVGKVVKRGEDLFLFVFFFSSFFFLFFFFLLFTFEKDGNLFGVYQNGNFLPGTKHFTPGKKSGKMTLPPQKNMPVTPLDMIPYYGRNETQQYNCMPQILSALLVVKTMNHVYFISYVM